MLDFFVVGIDKGSGWLTRKIECVRGRVELDVELVPGFNYARDSHTATLHVSRDAQVRCSLSQHFHRITFINLIAIMSLLPC